MGKVVSSKKRLGGGGSSVSSHDLRSSSENRTNASKPSRLLEAIFNENTQEDAFDVLSLFAGKFHIRYNTIRNCIELYMSDAIEEQFLQQDILLRKKRSKKPTNGDV